MKKVIELKKEHNASLTFTIAFIKALYIDNEQEGSISPFELLKHFTKEAKTKVEQGGNQDFIKIAESILEYISTAIESCKTIEENLATIIDFNKMEIERIQEMINNE